MRAVPFDSDGLARFLDTNAVRLHDLSPDEFRAWLLQRLREQGDNAVFQQRLRIQSLLRPHRNRLRQLEQERDDARSAYERSPYCETIERLQRQVERLRKGVEGLRIAVAEGRADPGKLSTYQEALQRRGDELDTAAARCPQKTDWEHAVAALSAFHTRIGVADAEDELARMQHQRGRRSGVAGRRFEDFVEDALRADLGARWRHAASSLVVLRGVTLGAAQTELDFVIGRVDPGEAAMEVLAVVEAKRNINDLVSGFLQRQRNLGWLTRDERAYDAAAFRTRSFPTGHFDRPATHRQDGVEYTLTSDSFRHFHREEETGWFLDRLCFASRLRPLLGVTTLELARILNRVATRREFDRDDPAQVERLRAWSLTFVSPMQSYDVLRRYCSFRLARQIIAIEEDGEKASAGTAASG